MSETNLSQPYSLKTVWLCIKCWGNLKFLYGNGRLVFNKSRAGSQKGGTKSFQTLWEKKVMLQSILLENYSIFYFFFTLDACTPIVGDLWNKIRNL